MATNVDKLVGTTARRGNYSASMLNSMMMLIVIPVVLKEKCED